LRATIGTDVLTLVCRRPDFVAEQVQAKFGWTAVVQDGSRLKTTSEPILTWQQMH
jgi:hypothetical protein